MKLQSLSLLRSALAGLAVLAGGCAPSLPTRHPLEDLSRRVAPLPACVLPLEPRGPHSSGTRRPLREPDILRLTFPEFKENAATLARNARSCVGTTPFLDPDLVTGVPMTTAWPLKVAPEDILYGAGGDRLRVIWLRVLHFGDGTVGGPLAIVRGSEQFAELFALGVYRGNPDSILGTARIGPALVVTADDDGCANRAPHASCDRTLALFLPHLGLLREVAKVATERVAFNQRAGRGAASLEFRLSTAADYRADGVAFIEQISVRDESGREVHKAERERKFLVDAGGTLSPSGPSLWDSRMAPEKSELVARAARQP